MATLAETWGYPLTPETFTTENPPALIAPRWSATQRRVIQSQVPSALEAGLMSLHHNNPTPPNRAESKEQQ